jgi:hypothetical protein
MSLPRWGLVVIAGVCERAGCLLFVFCGVRGWSEFFSVRG